MIKKEKVKETLDQLPDEFTVDELIDHLLIVEKINRGIRASDAGDVYTVEEAKEKLYANPNKVKLDLISWINRLSDLDLLSFLDGLRNSRNEDDWWNELSADQRKVVLSGLEDAENGNLLSSEDFWKKLKDV